MSEDDSQYVDFDVHVEDDELIKLTLQYEALFGENVFLRKELAQLRKRLEETTQNDDLKAQYVQLMEEFETLTSPYRELLSLYESQGNTESELQSV